MTQITNDTQAYQGALTTQRVAEITGLPGHVIRRAIRKGHLPAVRPPGVRAWRITTAALQEWLAAGSTVQNKAK